MNKYRLGVDNMELELRIKLDDLLINQGNMTQKQLIELIKEKTGKTVRSAAVSELYNNQRKSLNKELIETIATVLEITDANAIFSLEPKNHQS